MAKVAPTLYTVEEAAKLLRIGRTKAYALTQEWRATSGESGLPVVDFGHVLRVPRAALEKLLGVDLTTADEPPRPDAEAQPISSGAPPAREESVAATASAPSSKRRPRPTTSDGTDQLDLFNVAS